MSVKLRLRRYGKKNNPFYRIVVINSRIKRDGKFIDVIGTYNTNTNPSDIRINIDLAIKWLNKGAIPSNTVYSILSQSGVLYKIFLQKGINKNVITQDIAKNKFSEWIKNKKNITTIV